MTSSHRETELALASDGPARLLAGGTAFEQSLLQSAHGEPVPDVALQRIARSLNAPLATSAAPSGAGAAKGLSRWVTAGVLGGLGLVAPLIASHWRPEKQDQGPVPEQPALQARLNPAPDQWPLTVTDSPAPPTATQTVTAEPSAPRSTPRTPPPEPRRQRHAAVSPRRDAAEKAPPSPPDRSLRAELRALEAVQQTLAAGRAADAARALDRYHEQFPGGELALEAELLGVDVALGTGQKQLARARAAALLGRGDGARYRDRLNALLKSADERIETNAAPHERAEVVQP
jgi:hypothetical protein